MNPVLECQNLTKQYSGPFPALHQVNLSFPRGKIIGLLGPNGSGKSTLIKLASGLLTPTSGQLFINGNTPGTATKAKVSYLPEKDYLPMWMNVNDILSYFSDFYEDFDMTKAHDMLQRLQLPLDMRLKAMSKGTLEKLQLVLVMSRNADLFLLDEPIAGVDPAARDYILDTIIGNYNENATIVISTHLIADIEKILDEIFFIGSGQIVLQGSVDELRATYGKSIDMLFREVFRC